MNIYWIKVTLPNPHPLQPEVFFLKCKSEHCFLQSYFLQIQTCCIVAFSLVSSCNPFFLLQELWSSFNAPVSVLPCLKALCILPQLLFAQLMSHHPTDSLHIPQEAFLDPLPIFELGWGSQLRVPPMCPHHALYILSCYMHHSGPKWLGCLSCLLT